MSVLIVEFSQNIDEKEIHRMYKVELSFDIESLDAETVREICEKTDAIFEREDLKCTESQLGRRVYLDRGRAQDYGRFWAAIFALKDATWIVEHLKECFWYNGLSKENPITEFMRE